jgi:hypothetical protein
MRKRIIIELEVVDGTTNERVMQGTKQFIIDSFQKPETAIIKVEDIT